MRIATFTLMFTIAVGTSSLQASGQSIGSMLDSCSSVAAEKTLRNDQEVYCFAYIEGLNVAMQAACQLPNNETAPSIGYLPSTSAGARAFLAWVDRHPDTVNQPFSGGMMSALEEAFPCSR